MKFPALLTVLRTETTSLHKALEAAPPMARFDAEDLERVDVARVLAILAVGIEAFEAELDEPWYRPQTPAIRAELRVLGATAGPALPTVPLRSLGAKLGAAYVLVGSRLGARTIGRRLISRFGEEYLAESPYYGQDAAHTKSQWETLLERLAIVPEDEYSEATKTACFAFETLIQIASRPANF